MKYINSSKNVSRFFTFEHVTRYDIVGTKRSEFNRIYMAGTYITNLKELMHQKKITGTELAKRVGTNRRAIVCWRHGINRPHKNNLMLLQREFMDPKTGISQLYFHKNPHH